MVRLAGAREGARLAGRCTLVGAALLALLAGGCSRDKHEAGKRAPSTAPSASAAPVVPAPIASGFPGPKVVSDLVNPNAEPAYSGPTGTVRGRVIATGDPPPDLPDILAKISDSCASARGFYGKLFRVGPEHALADALVAVTGYKGYVPERQDVVPVTAKDCSFGTRTLAVTFGQRIDVKSGDTQTYIPELMGEHNQPQLVATPGNKTASPLYPTRIGHFLLVDDLRLFMTADVFVLKFATHAVTGLDGRFEISGVPVGPVKVNALLPATGGGAGRVVTVEAGKPTSEIVLEVPFDADAYAKLRAAAPASASASSHPEAPPPRASAHP